MATILQQQLAAIAANSTHQLDLQAQKARHSKSLLFEPRDAGSQSFDTIYQVCIEGFEELCQLDARFVPYSASLFSEQSKNEDREVMTAKENQELDRVINNFLGLLGGRLLLKPAMKAAEWLVRRFRAHETNTEVMLLTFLPYHSYHIFTALLSIIPEQLPPNCRFLHPYVSALQCPPRHAIVSAASNHPAFFAALSNYVLDVARLRHHSAVVLGFWASISAQAVNGMVDTTRSGRENIRKQREEDLLLRVLPILQSALSIKGVPELYLGTCMITTILATKSSLSDKVLDAMMVAIAGSWTEQTVHEGIICLAVLAEERERLGLPVSVTRAIVQRDNAWAILSSTGKKCRVEKLLTSVALGAVDSIAEEPAGSAGEILNEAMHSDMLDEASKVHVLTKALTSASDITDHDNGYARTPLVSTLRSLEVEDLLDRAARESGLDLARIDQSLAMRLQTDVNDREWERGIADEEAENLRLEMPDRQPVELTALPKLPGKQSSFLAPAHDDVFDEYYSIFEEAMSSPSDLSAFLEVSMLQKSLCTEQPTFFSFFARVATSDVPTALRLKSVQIMSSALREGIISKTTGATDMQALIPYLVTALGDSSKAVRAATVSMWESMGKLSGSKAAPWGASTLYGKDTHKIHWLVSSDAHKVISNAILPLLENCIVDANHITEALADIMNATSTSGTERKELKSALRSGLYALLASHVVVSPIISLKLRLLRVLRKVGKIAGSHRTAILLPHIREHFERTKDPSNNSQVSDLSKALISCVTHRSTDEIRSLKALAAGEMGSDVGRIRLGFQRLHHIWSSMKEAMQQDLVLWLLGLSLESNVLDEVQTEAMDLLRSLPLTTDILVYLLDNLPTTADLQAQPAPVAKRQRTSRTSDVAKLSDVDKNKSNAAIRKITFVLELVEYSKPEKHPALLKGLFHLLSELRHYQALLDSELGYLQGSTINSLLSVVNGLKGTVAGKEADRSCVRADLVVDCARTTSNTQVHHAALLLMSALASWTPDLVLHSVMPLFTFMSSTILKHGDDYSAHVADQTVSRIIPPLAASLKKRGKDIISGAAELLLSFTAAFEHIPLHRRLGLFRHLVQTLGPEEALFAIIAMLIERYPLESTTHPFVRSLMGCFSIAAQLCATRQYLDLVFDALKPKRTLSDAILGFAEKDNESATQSIAALLSGLKVILSQGSMRKVLARHLSKNNDDAEGLRITYAAILERTMQLELQLESDGDLSDQAGELLTAILGLMPTKDFIDSSAKLMQTGSDEIRQQVFWSLEQRVLTAQRGDASVRQVFIEVLPNCAFFVTKTQPVETRVAAIACIDRICEKFGKSDRAAVVEIAKQVASDVALGSHEDNLKRMSLLCLASMVEVLRDEFVPILPQTLQHTLDYLEAAVDADEANLDPIAACFAFAMAVLDHIPWMLSAQHLDSLFVCGAKTDAAHAGRFRELAAKQLTASTCFDAILRSWDDVVGLGPQAAVLQVQTLRLAIQRHPKATITKQADSLLDIFIQAFDLRRRFSSTTAAVQRDVELYDLVNATTMEAVLKLNDATFRPIFHRLEEQALSPAPHQDHNAKVHRCISFYSFAHMLFEQLESLVTSYGSFLLTNTPRLLTDQLAKPTSDAERMLLDVVAQTLTSSFAHDQDGFWQAPTHFEAIAEPLLSQLRKAGSIDIDQHMIPAIAELASAANSPDHHKSIEVVLRSYMRAESAAVRLAAVKCERALTDKLGLDWCLFMPEWLPFISELQEDDDGPVERETLRWIEQIQQTTGEDLNRMME